jgi:hypothetical protein
VSCDPFLSAVVESERWLDRVCLLAAFCFDLSSDHRRKYMFGVF